MRQLDPNSAASCHALGAVAASCRNDVAAKAAYKATPVLWFGLRACRGCLVPFVTPGPAGHGFRGKEQQQQAYDCFCVYGAVHTLFVRAGEV